MCEWYLRESSGIRLHLYLRRRRKIYYTAGRRDDILQLTTHIAMRGTREAEATGVVATEAADCRGLCQRWRRNQLCGPEQGQGRPTRCLVPSADGARSLSQSIFIVKHTVDDRRRYAFVVLRVRYALWAAFTHCGNVRNAIMCVGRCGR